MLPTYLIVGAVLLLVATGSLVVAMRAGRRRLKWRNLSTKLLSRNSDPAHEKVAQRKLRAPGAAKKRKPLRVPFVGKLVDEAAYIGMGKFSVPFVVGLLSLSWPLSHWLPIDHLPHAVPFVVALVISIIGSGALLGIIAGKKRDRIEADIPVFLDALARGLRVGKPFERSLTEGSELLGPAMKTAVEEIRIGTSVGFSASAMFEQQAHKTGVAGFHFISAALQAWERSGGDMAPAMESLSGVARSQRDIRLKVKSHAAQGKFGGYLITGLPVAFLIIFTNFKFVMVENFYAHSIGNVALVVVLCLVFASYLAVNKIASMKV